MNQHELTYIAAIFMAIYISWLTSKRLVDIEVRVIALEQRSPLWEKQ
jgi:hypothetical protein